MAGTAAGAEVGLGLAEGGVDATGTGDAGIIPTAPLPPDPDPPPHAVRSEDARATHKTDR
jgi:hypothetical protein